MLENINILTEMKNSFHRGVSRLLLAKGRISELGFINRNLPNWAAEKKTKKELKNKTKPGENGEPKKYLTVMMETDSFPKILTDIQSHIQKKLREHQAR